MIFGLKHAGDYDRYNSKAFHDVIEASFASEELDSEGINFYDF